jgi:hypothetical protein
MIVPGKMKNSVNQQAQKLFRGPGVITLRLSFRAFEGYVYITERFRYAMYGRHRSFTINERDYIRRTVPVSVTLVNRRYPVIVSQNDGHRGSGHTGHFTGPLGRTFDSSPGYSIEWQGRSTFKENINYRLL